MVKGTALPRLGGFSVVPNYETSRHPIAHPLISFLSFYQIIILASFNLFDPFNINGILTLVYFALSRLAEY